MRISIVEHRLIGGRFEFIRFLGVSAVAEVALYRDRVLSH